jgi:hypothetical protein
LAPIPLGREGSRSAYLERPATIVTFNGDVRNFL